MIGVHDPERSWEKQNVWHLDNGWTAIVEYNQFYGELVSRLDGPQGQLWHCSDGMTGVPDFAQPWIETLDMPAQLQLCRPNFEKTYAQRNLSAAAGPAA